MFSNSSLQFKRPIVFGDLRLAAAKHRRQTTHGTTGFWFDLNSFNDPILRAFHLMSEENFTSTTLWGVMFPHGLLYTFCFARVKIFSWRCETKRRLCIDNNFRNSVSHSPLHALRSRITNHGIQSGAYIQLQGFWPLWIYIDNLCEHYADVDHCDLLRFAAGLSMWVGPQRQYTCMWWGDVGGDIVKTARHLAFSGPWVRCRWKGGVLLVSGRSNDSATRV